MAKKKQKVQLPWTDEELRNTLPPGVKLLRMLVGHQERVTSVAFDPTGQMLAGECYDQTVKLWDVPTADGHHTQSTYDLVCGVAFDPLR